MTRVLVTGASGMLAATLIPELSRQGFDVVGTSRHDTGGSRHDLAVASEAEALLSEVQPALVVNLAAATNVDLCEREPVMAYAANAISVANIVRWIESTGEGCHLLQVSTDQVYFGAGPHAENDVAPVNIYGFSKYAGELIAARVPSTVIRTNLFGRSYCAGRESLSDWLVKVLRTQASASVFEDIFFSPLTMATLAGIVVSVCRRPVSGTYNVGSRNGTSKADFAFGLASRIGLSADRLIRGRSVELPGRARRPVDMRMNVSLFEQTYGLLMPTLDEELDIARSEYERSA